MIVFPQLDLLAFCLAAGSLTLFMSIVAIVAGCAVREAVADGRVSEEERRVIWCVANQNNFLLSAQCLTFVSLFGYVGYYYNKVSLFGFIFGWVYPVCTSLVIFFKFNRVKKVDFTDATSPYYCKRNVYIVCLVLSVVMVTGGVIAIIVFLWMWIVDTRRNQQPD